MKAIDRVLNFINDFEVQHNRLPSQREIGIGLGFNSSRTAHTYLKRLFLAGELTRAPGGFCDCGNRATTWKIIQVGLHGETTEVLQLCDDCTNLEQRLSPVSSYRMRQGCN